MSESYDTANNGINEWEGDIYIYHGGKVDQTDRDNIESVRIDESVSIVDDFAFGFCVNLQTVEFSTNYNIMIKKIGNKSFIACHNLLLIDLQHTQVEIIGNYAFYDCHKLATVQFPVTVRQIEKRCFYRCYQLKAIDLSQANYLESIGESAFASCSTLKSVNLPPTTLSIGKKSFLGCDALEMVDLRATCIDEIGEDAFTRCKTLTNIYFPTTTKFIGQNCFDGCTKLVSLELQSTNIERIGDRAFYECSNLQTVNFPKTLKYIGKYCFYHCHELKHLNLQETPIEKIGDRAFCKCTNLTTVVGIFTSHQEEQLQEIVDSESFQLPASLLEVGEYAFDECPNSTTVIDNNQIHFECDINRGGRKFLQRDHHHHHHRYNGSNDDGDAKHHGKVYYSSLWPLILYRVMHEMELPQHAICANFDDLDLYTEADPLQRRASVVYYLLIHGIVADL